MKMLLEQRGTRAPVVSPIIWALGVYTFRDLLKLWGFIFSNSAGTVIIAP